MVKIIPHDDYPPDYSRFRGVDTQDVVDEARQILALLIERAGGNARRQIYNGPDITSDAAACEQSMLSTVKHDVEKLDRYVAHLETQIGKKAVNMKRRASRPKKGGAR